MTVSRVQTKTEIEQLLLAEGLSPRKRFGQHFLVDGNLMRRLIDQAGVGAGDLVLEVGPGTGGLTDLLAQRAGRVVCVEIDRGFVRILRRRFEDVPQVSIVEGDILESKHRVRQDITEMLRSYDGRCLLVANLPYNIATPLVMNLLVDTPEVTGFCFSVQAEVGGRMAASPGGKDYGPLAILCSVLARVEIAGALPREAFWPRPAVQSVIVRMTTCRAPWPAAAQVRRFAGLVRGTFEHRRKKMRAALRYVIGPEGVSRLQGSGLLDLRPEQVDAGDWVALFDTVESGDGAAGSGNA